MQKDTGFLKDNLNNNEIKDNFQQSWISASSIKHKSIMNVLQKITIVLTSTTLALV